MFKLLVEAQHLLNVLRGECGQDAVEYAILVGILATGAIGSVSTISTYVQGIFTGLAASL